MFNHSDTAGYRIAVRISLLLCLLYCLFVFGYEKDAYRRAQRQLDAQARIIADALWNFNHHGAYEYLKLAASTHDYESLIVTDHGGQLFEEVATGRPAPLERLLMHLHLIPRVRLVAYVQHQGNIIGWLEAVWLPQTVYLYLYVLFALIMVISVILLYSRLLYANQSLEEGVRQRTVQLTQSNLLLQVEIAERKRAEEGLRENEEKYRQLFEMESDAIFLVAKETGQILEVNAAGETMYGYGREELLAMKNTDLSAEPDATRKATLEQRLHIPIRYHRKKDGMVFPVEMAASHFTLQGREVHVVAIRDISSRMKAEQERERLGAQLLQAHKMEAVGTLAGGIAHDFNNLLQVVQGYVELLVMDKQPGEPDQQALQEIILAVRRGAELTRQLLTFSRKIESRLQPMDLNGTVERIKALLSRTIPKMIQIDLNLNHNLPPIHADSSQIEQVLMNLSLNARDAMPEGGRLLIETEALTIDEEDQRFHPEIAPGRYALLKISDTGHGMDAETLEHIFDPFFTTKEVGQGTGLGLAMVYGIVKNHDGYIHCYSEPNRGTTFRAYLPIADIIEEASQKPADELIRGGSETVLIVDDEAPIRDYGEKVLTRHGYRTLTAQDGKKALEIYEAQRAKIDLVILDLIMPGMGGRQVLKEILSLNPAAKIIIASGYSLNSPPPPEEEPHTGVRSFIHKPYEMRQLLRVVRQVLDGK